MQGIETMQLIISLPPAFEFIVSKLNDMYMYFNFSSNFGSCGNVLIVFFLMPFFGGVGIVAKLVWMLLLDSRQVLLPVLFLFFHEFWGCSLFFSMTILLFGNFLLLLIRSTVLLTMAE